jgi:hypothetical protein
MEFVGDITMINQTQTQGFIQPPAAESFKSVDLWLDKYKDVIDSRDTEGIRGYLTNLAKDGKPFPELGTIVGNKRIDAQFLMSFDDDLNDPFGTPQILDMGADYA